MKLIQNIAVAVSLSLVALCSHAENQSNNISLIGNPSIGMTAGLSDPTGTAVNHTLSGTFTDTFTFSSFSGMGVIDVWLDTSVSRGNEATQQIVFTSATLNGIALTIDADFVSGNTTFRSAGLFEQDMSGPLTLIVNGYAGLLGDTNRQISASYSGGINVTPVPEPTQSALLLAGLGAIAFVARRRTKR